MSIMLSRDICRVDNAGRVRLYPGPPQAKVWAAPSLHKRQRELLCKPALCIRAGLMRVLQGRWLSQAVPSSLEGKAGSYRAKLIVHFLNTVKGSPAPPAA